MANELAQEQSLQISGQLIDKIIGGLQNGTPWEKSAADFWQDNKVALIGLGVAELTTILRNAADRTTLLARYNELVKSMTWAERIIFLKGAKEELQKVNSEKIKTAIIISSLVQLAPKILPIILAVV